ncbi:MAG: hypothetical protein ACOYXC_12985 [Candidatus Rifleibacteriota bacterium]
MEKQVIFAGESCKRFKNKWFSDFFSQAVMTFLVLFGAIGSVFAGDKVVSIKSTLSGKGCYVLFKDGGIHTYGDAVYFGHGTGGDNEAVDLGMTVTGKGYYILSKNGGIHTYGDAPYYGHGKGGDNAAVSLAVTRSGGGYYILSKNGGIHTYGDAVYCGHGKGGDNEAVAMALTISGKGYYILSKNGGIHTYGDAEYLGHGTKVHKCTSKDKTFDAVDIAVAPARQGYWILDEAGAINAFGSAKLFCKDYLSTGRLRESDRVPLEKENALTKDCVAFAVSPIMNLDETEFASGGLMTMKNGVVSKNENGSKSVNPDVKLPPVPIIEDKKSKPTETEVPVFGYWMLHSDSNQAVVNYGTAERFTEPPRRPKK